MMLLVGYDRPSVLRWAIGSSESACSPRVHKGFLHTEPQHKNMQKNRKDRSLSVPDQDWTEHLAWSPGAKKKGCPLLLEPLEEGQRLQDGLKAEGKFHRRPHQHACVCVCVSCVATKRMCVVLCVVLCDNKT